jgi:hypothetical protein
MNGLVNAYPEGRPRPDRPSLVVERLSGKDVM